MSALVLKSILSPQEVSAILVSARGKLVADDRAGQTASIFGGLQRRKHRLALPGTDPEGDGVARLTADAASRSFLFQAATYPQAHSRPRLCCYGPGMEYRDHLDVPLIGKTQLRTDVSVTISLVDADDYDGGDLVIDSDGFEARWKGNAGDCILYPSDSIHRVEPGPGASGRSSSSGFKAWFVTGRSGRFCSTSRAGSILSIRHPTSARRRPACGGVTAVS